MSSQTDASTVNEPVTGVCVRCGGPAENDFSDFWLCTDCYAVAGSTCAGVDLPRGGRPSDQVC